MEHLYFLKGWGSDSAAVYTKETAASSIIYAPPRKGLSSIRRHGFYYTAPRQVTPAIREVG
ncbi:MAG TPA: hypothetical protein VF511_09530, partial [Chthoniobacterales bacterium]